MTPAVHPNISRADNSPFPRVVEAEPEEFEEVADNDSISPVPSSGQTILTPHRNPLRSLSQQHHAQAITSTEGNQMEYRHLIANPTTKATWEHSFCNEVGRLVQG